MPIIIVSKFENDGITNCMISNINLGELNDDILEFVNNNNIDMVVVGPEVYLVNGIADFLHTKGVKCFGPNMHASQIEGSKEFSKLFMKKHNIPTADFEIFNYFELAETYINDLDEFNHVIKASGLAGGKGVVLPNNKEEALIELEEIMINKKFGNAGDIVIIEDKLIGEEVSVFAFCNGKKAFLMPQAQDYKRSRDNDEGLNTGGMGAHAPVNVLTSDELEELEEFEESLELDFISHRSHKQNLAVFP